MKMRSAYFASAFCLLTGFSSILPVYADAQEKTINAPTVSATTSAPTTTQEKVAETPKPIAVAVAPAEAPLTKPTLIDASKISAGDTAWMLTSTALVLLMTIPGLALFYAGMVRQKNVLSTIVQSFATTCLITVLWVIAGYSLAFMPGSGFIGSLDRLFLHGMDFLKEAGKVTVHESAATVPESVFMMYQMTFAIITPALIAGAIAERIKFSALLLFMGAWSLFIYAPVAHWVWEPNGWLATKGVLDFAGGTAVHINAGIAGLVAALMLGRRTGFGKTQIVPHNLGLTLIGASLLWVGWFGFNAGSAAAADGRAGMAMTVTQLATATAALAWMFAEWLCHKKPTVLGIASGAVAGMVAITPAAGFVGINGAFAIGIAAGVICYFASTSLKAKFGYDDSLDVFGVHAVGGIVGSLLTGVFAVKSIGGVEGSLATQAIGVGATLLYSGVGTAIILKVVDILVGLRVTTEQETEGLDLSQHGEQILAINS